MFKSIIEAIKNKIGQLIKPKEGKVVFISPIPLSTPTPQAPNIVRAIQKGFEEWGGSNVPVATLSAVFKEAAEKNKIDPYLLPAVSILETGGGRKETQPNNPLNWAIHEPTFQPKTPVETINKAASGIGTGRAFPYYEDFRRTGDIKDFASHYAPPNENDTLRYTENLRRLMEMFRKYQ